MPLFVRNITNSRFLESKFHDFRISNFFPVPVLFISSGLLDPQSGDIIKCHLVYQSLILTFWIPFLVPFGQSVIQVIL